MNGLATKPDFTNITKLVNESLRLLSKQAEIKSITIINKIDKNVITWSDKDQIDIVIRNLISNAVKFTREFGSIIISATEQPDYWQISIQDNGVGMEKNTVNNIFKTEEMTSSYGTLNEKGTGLGLNVCKEMVENNGGHIWTESELDKGSTFYFTIPKTENVLNKN
jgi:signal transduction histidine kinase